MLWVRKDQSAFTHFFFLFSLPSFMKAISPWTENPRFTGFSIQHFTDVVPLSSGLNNLMKSLYQFLCLSVQSVFFSLGALTIFFLSLFVSNLITMWLSVIYFVWFICLGFMKLLGSMFTVFINFGKCSAISLQICFLPSLLPLLEI